MRSIAVLDHFLSPAHRREIEKAAASAGFSVDFYPGSEAVPAQKRGQYEILYGMPRVEDVKTFPALQWLCGSFAGVERYLDESIYPHPSVLLSNSSGAYGVTISEHILMVTLMLLRQMPVFQREMAARHWQPSLPVRSICGSAITVVGTGDIGTSFARRAKALGAASLWGVRRSAKAADPCFDGVFGVEELDELLPRTDILVLALPATAETAGILSRRRIALLSDHAVVVNVGRGSAVDQEALAEALNSGALAGAALDVTVPEPLPPDHFLWQTRNLILTPHVAGNMSLELTRDLDVELFCEDLARYAAGEPLLRLVDRARGY